MSGASLVHNTNRLTVREGNADAITICCYTLKPVYAEWWHLIKSSCTTMANVTRSQALLSACSHIEPITAVLSELRSALADTRDGAAACTPLIARPV